jgi:hypothetical protein
MIGRLSAVSALFIAAGAGAALATYGEIEPCRMLAKDKAMEAEENSFVQIFGIDPEPYYRLETSQYSTGRCLRELAAAWWRRATD